MLKVEEEIVGDYLDQIFDANIREDLPDFLYRIVTRPRSLNPLPSLLERIETFVSLYDKR